MEAIKNIVYAGVGLATTATDKIKQSITDLVEKGKISDTEGKKIIDDIFKSTENTKEEFENKVKTITDKISSKFDFKGKKEGKVIDALQKKIAALEKQLAASKKTVAKKTTTAKKTVTSKKTVTAKRKPAVKTTKPAAKKPTTRKTTATKKTVATKK